MNFWIISLFDPTPMDNVATARFVGIAEAAVAKGHAVTHFTSTFRHPSKSHRFESDTTKQINDRYQVVYLKSPGYKQNMRPKRFIAHWQYARIWEKYANTLTPPDYIIVSLPPLSLADYVTEWASKKNIPVLVDFIDPWPDSFIKDVPDGARPFAKIAITPFYNKLKRVLKRAKGVSAISQGYIDWALGYYQGTPKPNRPFYPAVDFQWIQDRFKELEEKQPRQDKLLRLIYAGSLASSYDIPAICKAAEILEAKYPGRTEFLIAGTGPQEDMVKEYASKLSNLKYLGWMTRDTLTEQYYLSDLGLIQHMNSLTQTVTYKLFSYLSAGLPVLNSLQSEMVNIIEDHQVGLNNKEGDFEKLAENIACFLDDPGMLETYKKNALKLTAEKGDTQKVYADMVDYLIQL